MNKLLPLVAFIVICLADFIGIYFENQLVIYIAKPLLMISLFWYYKINTENINKFFVYGLFFSFLGDVFLLGKGELFFILGLASFLIAHLFYIMMVVKLLVKTTIKEVVSVSIPYVIIFILLLNLLYEHLGGMKIPVIIYALVISVFGTVSLLLFIQKKTDVYLVLVMGVFVFIVSDSVLAINMFYQKEAYFSLVIMLTYVLAQFLICSFVLKLNTKK
ncbi:MAG: lysoplasmalogenase [Flavobacteriaceae bacterium]